MTLVRAVEGSRGLVDNDAMAIGSDGSFQVAVDGDGTVLGLEVGEATLIEAGEGSSGQLDDGAMTAGISGSSRLRGRDRVGLRGTRPETRSVWLSEHLRALLGLTRVGP